MRFSGPEVSASRMLPSETSVPSGSVSKPTTTGLWSLARNAYGAYSSGMPESYW